ncbi:MFS transporter [Amycolatopsis nigrescens]|uniref:MFS transporter n=1 Tax=Amycolatopsis nigrescens TaxID=381445 RepID=UPI000684A349|nr:MFS transporter [Amycolatopsis nigrescens]
MAQEVGVEAVQGESRGHPRRWVILAVLCLALLVVLLDNTVLSVAIPSITDSLHASTSDVQWMINAYSLVLAGLLMTTGSLADRLGRKRALLFGVALFTAGSAVAAFSETSTQLIIARAGMGVGAAFLMPGTLAVLMQIFDEKERPKAIAAWTAVASMGLALGPVIGGVLLDHFWWGSVFLINIPVGAVAIVAMVLLVPESRDPMTRKPDIPGVLLSIVMGVGLVYAVISVPEHGWGSANVLVPLVFGVLALTGFVLWERRAEDPMLDMTLFANPQFTGAVAGGALTAFAMGGSLFLFTQYLQFVLGYSPLQAGFAVMPMALSLLLVTPFSPRVSARLGVPLTLAVGLGVMGAGLLALSFVGTDSGYWPTLTGLVLIGGGVGIAMPASANALMGAIPPQRAGIASGLTSTLQEFGNALGVAILGSLMSAQFAAHLPELLPDGVEHSVGLALGAAAQAPDAASVVHSVRDAFVSGISLSLTCGAAAAVAAGLVAWALLRRGQGGHPDKLAESVQDGVHRE